MGNNKFRILHINAEYNWAGGEVQTFNLCAGLKDKSIFCVLACPGSSVLFKKAKGAGIEVVALDMKGFASIGAILQLVKIIKINKINIVHMHTYKAHYLGAFASLCAGVRNTVVTRRMDFAIGKDPLSVFMYGFGVKQIVAASDAISGVLVESGVVRSKIMTIHSSVNLSEYSPRLIMNAEAAIKHIGVAAHLYERKGIKFLIDAAERVLQFNRNVVFHVAGDGPLRQWLEGYVAEKGLKGKVVFHGHLEDIASFLDNLDIYVLPSLREGLGVSAIEAMAMKIPVVASRVGGIPEIVVDGATGILVAPGDSLAIAEAIIYLLNNPSIAVSMGAEARARVVEAGFTQDDMVSRYEDVYSKVLSGGK